MILAHATDGPDGARPLVLAGSLGTTMEMWRPQLGALAGPPRLIRLDVRGHGRSPAPDGPYTMAELGGDVLDTLDALGLGAVSFCGLSIGGMIGQWLAANAPERIERLILLFTAARAPNPQAFTQRAATVRGTGIANIADGVVEKWLTDAYRQAHPDTVAWLRSMLEACPAEGYSGCAEAIAAMDLRGELKRIAAPTLVVTGAQDAALPPVLGRDVAAGIAGAHCEQLDPAAHLGSLERPETLNPMIRNFLEV